MTTETPTEAYDRGIEAGKVIIRLDQLDVQIASTNALLARVVSIAQDLGSTVQTLTEARVTDAATRLTTAQAVKDAKDAQEAGWPPLAKFLLSLGGAVTTVAVLWAIFASLPHV